MPGRASTPALPKGRGVRSRGGERAATRLEERRDFVGVRAVRRRRTAVGARQLGFVGGLLFLFSSASPVCTCSIRLLTAPVGAARRQPHGPAARCVDATPHPWPVVDVGGSPPPPSSAARLTPLRATAALARPPPPPTRRWKFPSGVSPDAVRGDRASSGWPARRAALRSPPRPQRLLHRRRVEGGRSSVDVGGEEFGGAARNDCCSERGRARGAEAPGWGRLCCTAPPPPSSSSSSRSMTGGGRGGAGAVARRARRSYSFQENAIEREESRDTKSKSH